MSEMSRAQGPAHQDLNPTDDMVPPAAQSPRDPDAENFGPHGSGAEDVEPQDFGAEDMNPPLPRVADSGGEDAAPAQSSSDPMPDIAGEG
ncbi:MAG TPA: hypothetical protein VNC63_12240 [Propionibacteriaceae bacterium]|jgi:hypothetical protein|nr:hypothetical protein [Propionibacteriaceae bacterium]